MQSLTSLTAQFLRELKYKCMSANVQTVYTSAPYVSMYLQMHRHLCTRVTHVQADATANCCFKD